MHRTYLSATLVDLTVYHPLWKGIVRAWGTVQSVRKTAAGPKRKGVYRSGREGGVNKNQMVMSE